MYKHLSFILLIIIFFSGLISCHGPKAAPDILLKKNPGIKVDLLISAINKSNIVATITVKNATVDTLLYYKSLLGIGNEKVRIFGFADTEKRFPVPYKTSWLERFLGISKERLVTPSRDTSDYLVLTPGMIFTNSIPLNKEYDFSLSKGKMIGLYTVCLPKVSDNLQHVWESDLDYGSVVKPVYYSIDSDNYTEFELQ